MIEIAHNTETPELIRLRDCRRQQREGEPKSEDDWENMIAELAYHDNVMDTMDAVMRYASWIKRNTYRSVQNMLDENRDSRYAKQKIEFLIRGEER